MRARQSPAKTPERLTPELAAVVYLTSLVERLPDRAEDFDRHPAAAELLAECGLTIYNEALRLMPNREKFLRWLLDPYSSPFGADEPPLSVPLSRPYLWPSKRRKPPALGGINGVKS